MCSSLFIGLSTKTINIGLVSEVSKVQSQIFEKLSYAPRYALEGAPYSSVKACVVLSWFLPRIEIWDEIAGMKGNQRKRSMWSSAVITSKILIVVIISFEISSATIY